MSFRVFTRNWWRWEIDENGNKIKVPDPTAQKYTLKKRVKTEKEAKEICKEYNEKHDPGPLSKKAEFEEN